MTIDHNALSRRIAERLAFDRFIRQPSGMSVLETMEMVERCIASISAKPCRRVKTKKAA